MSHCLAGNTALGSGRKGRKECRSVEIAIPADGTIAAHFIREDFGTSRFAALRKTSRFHATEKQVSHFGQCLLRLVKTGSLRRAKDFPFAPRLTSLRGGFGRNPKMVNACHPCPRLGCEVGGYSFCLWPG